MEQTMTLDRLADLRGTPVLSSDGEHIGDVEEIFYDPQHPYTWSLLQAVPRLGLSRRGRLFDIPGAPPNLASLPEGCKFVDRCRFRVPQCDVEPPLGTVRPRGHRARCWVLVGSGPEASRRASHEEPGGSDQETSRHGIVPRDRKTLVRVENVSMLFGRGSAPPVRAVDGVSLEIRPGETLALIGESGCGKSTLARVIAQLLPPTSGEVYFEGEELTNLGGRRLRKVRRQIQMVFQDSYSSLDPRMNVRRIVAEPLLNYRVAPAHAQAERVDALLEAVGLTTELAGRYPHELSGGQRQRVGIARALALRPSLVICDEPVSSLDVSVQAQIINLLKALQAEFAMAYLFISHDLSVVRHLADRVAVMYLGRIVESATADELFRAPQHPYTRVLLDAVAPPDPRLARSRRPLLPAGDVPSPAHPPSGCRFHTRCPIARTPGVCADEEPHLAPHGPRAQLAACHFADEPKPPTGATAAEGAEGSA